MGLGILPVCEVGKLMFSCLHVLAVGFNCRSAYILVSEVHIAVCPTLTAQLSQQEMGIPWKLVLTKEYIERK